jgi:putative flavoprotein involved in K+ transport
VELVLATGGYQRSHLPGVRGFPESVRVIDAYGYRNPRSLPEGAVLVIGSGQTGCQLAEECFEAGREVYLACGRAPWLPRRFGGRDFVAWLDETPFLRQTLADLPTPGARLGANPQCSGHDGGHDLNYRTLQAMGVNLTGRLMEISGGKVHFADDLKESVAFGDARYADLCNLIRRTMEANNRPVPDMPEPAPFVAKPPDSVPLDRLGAVIYTAGFRPAYGWVGMPEAFDQMGYPLQVDGSSTAVPGLHFMGLHFQRVRASATLLGVAEDAEVLAKRLAAPA